MSSGSTKSRVLVTGGAGAIGRAFVKKLVEKGYEAVCFDLSEQIARSWDVLSALQGPGSVRFVEGTILDRFTMQRIIAGCNMVVHLAAMLGVQRCEQNRLECLEVNMNGSDNVLNACVLNRVEHVVVASSSEVYGEPGRNPVKETDEVKCKSVYAVSKLATEELAMGYHQIYPHMNYTIVRFFNTYGEGQVAQFVLARFVHNVLQGRNPVVYGDGTQTRGYCHLDDSAEGLCLILGSPIARNKVYNLGNSSEVYPLKQLAEKVIETLAPGKGLSVEIVGSFTGTDRSPEREIYNRYCDNSLARTELGFEPRISIEEGIRRIARFARIYADWPKRNAA